MPPILYQEYLGLPYNFHITILWKFLSKKFFFFFAFRMKKMLERSWFEPVTADLIRLVDTPHTYNIIFIFFSVRQYYSSETDKNFFVRNYINHDISDLEKMAPLYWRRFFLRTRLLPKTYLPKNFQKFFEFFFLKS